MKTRRDRPSRPWLLYLLGVVAIVVAALAVSEIGAPTSSARTSKEIVSAEQGVVQSTVTGSGNIAAGTDVSVNFNTSGTLQDVYVHVGQHVTGGQLLADLDPTAANLQLSQAQSQLTAAEDQLTCLQDQTTANCGSGGSGGSGVGVGLRFRGELGVGFDERHEPDRWQFRDSGVRVLRARVEARLGQEEEAEDRIRRRYYDNDHEDDDQDRHDGRSELEPSDDNERWRESGSGSGRIRVRVAVEVGLGERVGRHEDHEHADHDDDEHAIAVEPRLGPGRRLQRAGRRAHRRDRGQQHQALRADERDDRVAVESHAGRCRVRR